MAYKPRIEVPYGYYHVVTRGNNKRRIYDDDHDRENFLVLLERIARRYGWLFYAYCLMGNHYHLVMQIAEKGLSRGMCELNTAYAVTYNLRHDRINHLFGRRFWSELITTDAYLLGACRYVVQNPVRAGLCATCDDSSGAAIERRSVPRLLVPFLAAQSFSTSSRREVRTRSAAFRDFCSFVVPKRQRLDGPRVAATLTAV